MPRKVLRPSLLLAAHVAALVALVGCGQPSPVDTPPSAYQEAPPPPPPPPPPLAGGPDEPPAGAWPEPPPPAEVPPSPSGLPTWRDADGRLVTAMRPIPNDEVMAEAAPPREERPSRARPAETGAPSPRQAEPPRRAPAPPPPKTVAPPPAPVTPKPAARPPSLKTGPAPALTAVQTPAARMTAELTPVIAAGAKLAVPEAIAAGDPAAVTLTLPADLLATVQSEANALDLRRAARSVDVKATLAGDGYDVSPSGPQTVTLNRDEAAVFTWQVTPRARKANPLTAKVDAALTGGRSPFDFALGAVEAPVAQPESKAAWGMIDAPSLGPLPIRTLLGGGLILLAVILLAVLARRASAWEAAAAARRRAEREARQD